MRRMNMGRIEEIKERLNKFQTAPRDGFQKGLPLETVKVIGNFSDNAPADIEYLLSRLQIAEEALKNIVETVKERELERIFVPNIRYSIDITKIADTALEQIGE
jgi:hypothetical protein